MKHKLFRFCLAVAVVCPVSILAQDSISAAVQGQVSPLYSSRVEREVNKTIRNDIRKKPLAAWDFFPVFQQIALDNLTADEKSISFKSSLFGIRKLFDSKLDNSEQYKNADFSRRFEIAMNWNYQDNFTYNNFTAGFNYKLVNANDPASGMAFLNGTEGTFKTMSSLLSGELRKVDHAYRVALMKRYPDDSTNLRLDKSNKELRLLAKTKVDDILEAFIVKGDVSALDKDSLFKSIILADHQTKSDTTLWITSIVTSAQKEVQNVYDQIKRRWSVVVGPSMTYGSAEGSVTTQGYAVTAKAIKELNLFNSNKRTTQLLLNASYKVGDDSIVQKLQMHRKQLITEGGLNVVLVTHPIAGDDGEKEDKPLLELAIKGGFTRITEGGYTDENPDQPTMGAKLGLRIGKDAWIVVPFTYNFSRKEGQGAITLKVNLGDPPFK